MLTLALRLGMTLQDLRERMSAEELLLWMAYDRESPIGDLRGDVQTSMVAAAAFQAQGAKVCAMDLLPVWRSEAEPVDEAEEAEQGEQLFRSFLIAASETSSKLSTESS